MDEGGWKDKAGLRESPWAKLDAKRQSSHYHNTPIRACDSWRPSFAGQASGNMAYACWWYVIWSWVVSRKRVRGGSENLSRRSKETDYLCRVPQDVLMSDKLAGKGFFLMPRLLIATTVPLTLEAFLLPFAYHFRRRGWHVDGAASGISLSSACLEAFDSVWEMGWCRAPMSPANLWRAGPQIRRLVEREQYDIVHVHTPVAAFITRWFLGMNRHGTSPRVIYTAHGFHFRAEGSPLRNSVFLALEKMAGKWTDYLVVINEEDLEAAERHKLVRPGCVRHMPGIGLDTQFFSAGAAEEIGVKNTRSDLGLTESDVLFGMVARFDPGKRHTDAVRALAELQTPRFHVAFAGEGPTMPQVKALAATLGVENQVHLLGHCDDVRPLIGSSLATILPSEREGLSRSVMESLSMGVPVIGTDIRGIRDLVDSRTGILVQVGDVSAIAQGMRWLTVHRDQARAMGERGKARMAKYDISNIIGLHEALYEEALSDRTSCAPHSLGG
jgi:glycosyltransferase involved in cell wall biosynthesis